MTNSTPSSETQAQFPTFLDFCSGWHKAAENLDTFNRLITTDAKIAQNSETVSLVSEQSQVIPLCPRRLEIRSEKDTDANGFCHHEPALRVGSAPGT